jgi:hypothetical protein
VRGDEADDDHAHGQALGQHRIQPLRGGAPADDAEGEKNAGRHQHAKGVDGDGAEMNLGLSEIGNHGRPPETWATWAT